MNRNNLLRDGAAQLARLVRALVQDPVARVQFQLGVAALQQPLVKRKLLLRPLLRKLALHRTDFLFFPIFKLFFKSFFQIVAQRSGVFGLRVFLPEIVNHLLVLRCFEKRPVLSLHLVFKRAVLVGLHVHRFALTVLVQVDQRAHQELLWCAHFFVFFLCGELFFIFF